MVEIPTPTRRRFQFSLRTLLIVVTLLTVPYAFIGWQANIANTRKAMLERITSIDNGFVWPGLRNETANPVPWICRLLGDEAIERVTLPLQTEIDERRRIRASFPEATLYWSTQQTSNSILFFPFPEDKAKHNSTHY